MLRISLQPRICGLLRQFSASSRPVLAPYRRPNRVNQFIRVLARETDESLWKLLESIIQPRRLPLIQNLVANSIPVAEYTQWRRTVLRHANIELALPVLEQQGFMTVVEQNSRPIPVWLLLYLVGYTVRSPHHAAGPLLGLLFTNIESMPVEAAAGAITFSTLHLARFNMVSAMAQTVDTFLQLPLPPRTASLHFNLLLISLSRTPLRSEATAKTVMKVLLAMESRQLRLHDYTYRFLLEDRYVTLQLTQILRERMIREGFVPSVDHLEAYLRVFAKQGLIEDVDKYHEAVHSFSSDAHSTRANTLLLASHKDPASAFEFFHKLSPEPPTTPAMGPLDWNTHSMWFPHSSPERWRAGPKRSFSIYDWTAAFSVASRNHKHVNTSTLIKLFESSSTSSKTKFRSPFRPTTVSYIILLRGLLRRKAWNSAKQYFIKLLESGLRLERFSLSLGLQALIRSGQPHIAFTVLEQFCSRTDAQLPAKYQIRQPVTLTIASMNTILVSLLRIGRPDVVFRLWNGIDKLYGVHHDERTMSCLLQAARDAMIRDDTVWAKVEEVKLGIKELLRGAGSVGKHTLPWSSASVTKRDDLVGPIMDILIDGYTPSADGSVSLPVLKPMGPSVTWTSTPPLTLAKHIFYQALFTHSPSLASINTSPILPIVSDIDAEEFHWFKILPSVDGMKTVKRVRWILPNEIKDSVEEAAAARGNQRSMGGKFPAYVPSDKNFTHFLLMIATTSPRSSSSSSYAPSFHAAAAATNRLLRNDDARGVELPLTYLGTTEVPLVLAWMRELGIQPSRDTLVLALLLWREVNTQAPLIELWASHKSSGGGILSRGGESPDSTPPRGGAETQKALFMWKRWDAILRPGGGGGGAANEYPKRGQRQGPGQIQYQKLVYWIADWVGWENVPDPQHAAFAKMTRVVERLRRPAR